MIRHVYQDIPGFFAFPTLYDRIVGEAPRGSTLVEVGVLYGRSLAYLAVAGARLDKGFRIVGVDTFEGPELLGAAEPRISGSHREKTEQFLEPVRDLVELRAGKSHVVAQTFAVESVGAVFLDADHTREGVLADCLAWWPRIAQGGILAGDDWGILGVPQGVALWAAPASDVEVFEVVRGHGWEGWYARKRGS